MTMLHAIRKSRSAKFIAAFLSFNMILGIFEPFQGFALTGGPSQPEVESFEPVGTTEMVDIFSGDFVYNIPLVDVGGYPVNLSYHSGVSMDQEASCVGLGWNINPGVINRNMRGLPDDFSGTEHITQEMNIKPNKTWGLTGGVGAELFGLGEYLGSNMSFSLGIKYNNYYGLSFEQTFGLGMTIGKPGSSPMTANLGFNINSNNEDGITVVPSLSYSTKLFKTGNISIEGFSGHLSTSYNTREGLKSLSFGNSIAKMNDINASAGISSSLNFVTPTYVPKITMPMENYCLSLSAKIGGDLVGFDGTVDVSGFYSKNSLREKVLDYPAYGYLFSKNIIRDDQYLLDFNREKDIPFSENTPCLPVTNFTYDTYSISGQGVGGMFRPYRNDVGYIGDHTVWNTNISHSIGGEISTGNIFHAGLDMTETSVESESGMWSESNEAIDYLQFLQSSDDERFCFKLVGEKTGVTDLPADNFDLDGDCTTPPDPLMIKLSDQGAGTDYEVIADNLLIPSPTYTQCISLSGTSQERDDRQKRNTHISYLSVREAQAGLALQPSLYSSLPSEVSTTHRNQIAEITVNQPDGARYIYGLPAYNTTQHEVTFNVGSNQSSCEGGLVPYNPGVDNSKNNTNGRDNYYNRTITPPYAHSYLLTAVLSPDYVDNDGNEGPTYGDIGTYTKFIYEETADYDWRVPYDENMANYDQGFVTDVGDQKGSYVYGQKNLYYLSQIRTRTHVAVFEYSDRLDGAEVDGENGDQGTVHMKKLDKISLYTFSALAGGITQDDIPVKVVHFDYDYTLCPNVPNNSNYEPEEVYDPEDPYAEDLGKLTLKRIWFTYGNSMKGKLNPYEFDYSDFNPCYDMKSYDRWGFYKENDCDETGLPNHEFPYVDQSSQTTADENTSAWSLTEIFLPSGGEIQVNYESDDYKYVQDRKAMQMFIVKGVTDVNTESCNFSTGYPILYNYNVPNNRIYIELPEALSTDEQFYKRYLKDIMEKDDGSMYFRFNVNIAGEVGSFENMLEGKNEFISGYAKIVDYGVIDETSCAWVEIETLTQEEDESTIDINPISKAAWQFTKIHFPRLITGGDPYSDEDAIPNDLGVVIGDILNSSFIAQAGELMYGVYGKMRRDNFGRLYNPNKSWIRLMNPGEKKFGGGSRVKELLVYDGWKDMAPTNDKDEYEFRYGQKYDYTVTDENGNDISSGVAAYEPMIGNDENPLRQGYYYADKNRLLVPSDEHYVETPIGECFYPGAQVGYSRVLIRNIVYNDDTPGADPEFLNTGYTEHKFYTAKDFPVFTRKTQLHKIHKKTGNESNNWLVYYESSLKDYMNASQGYVIELNDMHGKPKSVAVYGEGSNVPTSKVDYFYHRDGNRLVNAINTINEQGQEAVKEIGVDYEMITDFREQTSHTQTSGVNVNINTFYIPPIILAIVPTMFPNYYDEVLRFRSAVVTNVVNRYGVLDKVRKETLGSVETQDYLAYDAETGEVLYSKTTTNFSDDYTYSFNYPAYWPNDRMGHAYKNTGLEMDIGITSGVISGDIDDQLRSGDEVSVRDEDGYLDPPKAWVWQPNDDGNKYLMDEDGALIADGSDYTIKVLRSGRRNQQALPAGSVVTMNDISSFAEVVKDDEVLEASAVEYDEKWRLVSDYDYDYLEEFTPPVDPTDCGYTICCNEPDVDNVNPYYQGLRGNWRPKKNYTCLALRYQSGDPDQKIDGYFNTFTSYWKYQNNIWTPSSSDYWISPAEISKSGLLGEEIENVDALGRYTCVVNGYGNSLPVATASNARHNEIGFEGFEDYKFLGSVNQGCTGCEDGDNTHFSFHQYSDGPPTNDRAHTGNYSRDIYHDKSALMIIRPIGDTPEQSGTDASSGTYTLHSDDNRLVFSPLATGKKYILSYWVSSNSTHDGANYSYSRLHTCDIILRDMDGHYQHISSLTCNLKETRIIDGWQKFDIEFEIPSTYYNNGESTIEIRFDIITDGTAALYIDDIRIHPSESNMKSYVYDETTLRLMAELDENNFATFYEYDEEGALVRVKKETERGIQTIQEVRKSFVKNAWDPEP